MPTGARRIILQSGKSTSRDNALLEKPLTLAHIKPRLARALGHDHGAQLHLRTPQSADHRQRPEHDLCHWPGAWWSGAGGALLPGRLLHRDLPGYQRSRDGLQRLFRQFSWPYGVPSHVAPQTPGSIHEGGELGYSLTHAYGAAFDNPDLIVACVVGDGEAETGPLAASWHSNKFLNPARDGAVLPILHLNGFKIANPTILARIGREELTDLLHGYGHEPHVRGRP